MRAAVSAAWIGAVLLLAWAPAPVRAQTTITDEAAIDPTAAQVQHPLSADFKGSIGGGLIGAELGFMLPALLGARDTWAFIVFPVVGAAAGTLAGYYGLERGDGHPEAAVAVLATGMALVIPATVVTLAASAYEPDTEVPLSRASRTARAAVAAGPGLLRWSEAGVLLAPPAVSVSAIPARGELQSAGARARLVRVPILSGVF